MTYYDDILKARQQFAQNYKQQNYTNCIIIGKKLLALYKKCDSSESMDYADEQYNLACVYQDAKNYAQAKLLYFDSMRRVKKLEGKDLAYADRLNNVAVCCARLGDVDNSVKYFKEAETIFTEKGKEYSAEHLDCLYNLANAYYDKGNYDEAIRMHVTVLFNRKDEGDSYADSLNCIGYAYEKMDDMENAVNYLKRAMSHIKKIHSENSEEYLSNLYYIGQVYYRKNDFKSAIKSYETACKIIKEMFSEENPYYGDALNRLAEALMYDGQREKSLKLRLTALKILKEHIGENHIYYANSLRNIALLYKDGDNSEKAIEYFMEALRIKSEILGAANTDYIKDVMLLSGMFIEKFEYDRAIALLQDTIDLLKREGGEFSGIIPEIMKIFNSIKDIKEIKDTLEKTNNVSVEEDDIFNLIKTIEARMTEALDFNDMENY